jgi:hypothetical protein
VQPVLADFIGKDSANRMQSSSLELLRYSLFSLISSAKVRTLSDPWNTCNPACGETCGGYSELW